MTRIIKIVIMMPGLNILLLPQLIMFMVNITRMIIKFIIISLIIMITNKP